MWLIRRNFSINLNSKKKTNQLIRLLNGLPSSLNPIDVKKFINRFIPNNNETIKLIYLPDPSSILTHQHTHIMLFSNEEQIQQLEHHLINSQIQDTIQDHEPMKITLDRIDKNPFGMNYLRSILKNNHQRYQDIPEEGEEIKKVHENLIPLRSGEAVMITGLPIRTDPRQIENTIYNFGFPIYKVQTMKEIDRIERRMYWPMIDPSPSCISNVFKRNRNSSISNSIVTRSQLIYTPSISISNFLVAELHQSRPSWLGHRKSNPKNPSPNNPNLNTNSFTSEGWKLKAQVIY